MSAASPPHALLRPRVALPFLLISLIWGSTWFVIVGQIDGVPPPWSVAWRFVLATAGMFALAMATGNSLAMPSRAHGLALLVGFCQFCGNYNLVYQSELHLTSGIVAVMIGLMIVPNAVLGRLLLDQPITGRFILGSAIAIGGIALLLVNEARETRLGGHVGLGIWLAAGAMIAASISNVIQAGKTGRTVPLMTLIAWSMLYGTLIDIAFAASVSMPVKILIGMQTGERASTEDQKAWNATCQGRRVSRLSRDILHVLNHLRRVRVLSFSGEISVMWDDLRRASRSERLADAKTMAETNILGASTGAAYYSDQEIREAGGFDGDAS